MAKRRLVTLLTDFGTRDPYVAAMRGVILRLAPGAEVVDLGHDVSPHDVLEAGFVLAQAAPYYPPETLHVVVVDPGVGTERRILAARFGGQRFLFPDNGVITFVAQRLPLEAIFAATNTRYVPWEGASATFHGRDIFAPVAAHILNGLDLGRLGPEPGSYKLLEIAPPSEDGRALVGQVVYVDRFGNLVSNIPEPLVRRRFADLERLRVTCGGRDVGGPQGSYGFVEPGQVLALFDSMGLVEVAVNQGRACDSLGASVGTQVRVAEA